MNCARALVSRSTLRGNATQERAVVGEDDLQLFEADTHAGDYLAVATTAQPTEDVPTTHQRNQ